MRRDEIFSKSFQTSKRHNGRIFLCKTFRINFIDENGSDYGGLTRDWFAELFKIIFNPVFGLFKASDCNQNGFYPNELSFELDEMHLEHFKFAGLMVGIAILYPYPIGFQFAGFFLKILLKKPVNIHDLKEIDEGLYNYICWLMDNNISEIQDPLYFVYEFNVFGEHRIVELVHDGSKILLDDENKFFYIDWLLNYILITRIEPQIHAFLTGFESAVPLNRISAFSVSELDRLISGNTFIDIDDWRRNTIYNFGYESDSEQVIWFWRFLRTLDQPLLQKILKLATGSSTVSSEGFRALRGDGIERRQFEIIRSFESSSHLPNFKTCCNAILIPLYSNYEELRHKFMIAINEGSEYFAFS